jgi:hypothetical protein
MSLFFAEATQPGAQESVFYNCSFRGEAAADQASSNAPSSAHSTAERVQARLAASRMEEETTVAAAEAPQAAATGTTTNVKMVETRFAQPRRSLRSLRGSPSPAPSSLYSTDDQCDSGPVDVLVSCGLSVTFNRCVRVSSCAFVRLACVGVCVLTRTIVRECVASSRSRRNSSSMPPDVVGSTRSTPHHTTLHRTTPHHTAPHRTTPRRAARP